MLFPGCHACLSNLHCELPYMFEMCAWGRCHMVSCNVAICQGCYLVNCIPVCSHVGNGFENCCAPTLARMEKMHGPPYCMLSCFISRSTHPWLVRDFFSVMSRTVSHRPNYTDAYIVLLADRIIYHSPWTATTSLHVSSTQDDNREGAMITK